MPLASTVDVLKTEAGEVKVNRCVLQRGDDRALVMCWYQGRGRVEANEYAVNLDLLRDAVLRRRSDEPLVRVLVPVIENQDAALAMATEVAKTVVPRLHQVLPPRLAITSTSAVSMLLD